jgi:crossover junction endodeoxyribonuclease RusA
MIELPYPHKALWPNGRPHHFAKAREVKKHRAWAHDATLATFPRCFKPPERLLWLVTIYPKPRGPLPDRDNASAACKAFFDGIADGLGINDNRFDEPRIQFGERTANGKVVFTLMESV